MRSRPNDVAVPDEKQSLAGSEKKLSDRVIANDQSFMATTIIDTTLDRDESCVEGFQKQRFASHNCKGSPTKVSQTMENST